MDIKEIAQDLIFLDLEITDTLQQCQQKFYGVMRKHGVKKGTATFNAQGQQIGIEMDNYEWTLCQALFHRRLLDVFTFTYLVEGVPEDLQC